jgi:hypothetical protein
VVRIFKHLFRHRALEVKYTKLLEYFGLAGGTEFLPWFYATNEC